MCIYEAHRVHQAERATRLLSYSLASQAFFYRCLLFPFHYFFDFSFQIAVFSLQPCNLFEVGLRIMSSASSP